MEAACPAKLRLFYVPPCIPRDVPRAGTAVFLSKLCHAGIISMGQEGESSRQGWSSQRKWQVSPIFNFNKESL